VVPYNPKNWFRHIFAFHKSDTLRILLPEMVIMALYTAGLTYADDHLWPHLRLLKGTIAVHSLVGVVLGLLLVFRTNTAYERWWEGRRIWGAFINDARTLAFKLRVFLPRERTADREFFAVMIPNYVFAVKEHLRAGVRWDELENPGGLLDALPRTGHVPNALGCLLYERVAQLHREGVIRPEQLYVLDKELKALTDHLGACERIRNTPIPYSYSLFLKKFLFFYSISLPLGLIPDFRYVAVPIVVAVFYLLVSLEILAEEIEDPFGCESNDLPTDDLAQRIRNNVAEILAPE
jgi:putative membrane protein